MLVPYDERWPDLAARRITDLSRVLGPGCVVDHIGSTSVPGLAAKPFLDLQARFPRLPDPAVLDPALATIGFLPHAGSRPDSPGVRRDSPRGSEQVPDEVWEKRLFTAQSPDSVLHLRRRDSPWGRYTVMFRDWLRAHPEQVTRYAEMKLSLAREHEGDPDFDDYTRAKTAYFDEVQPHFETWAGGAEAPRPDAETAH